MGEVKNPDLIAHLEGQAAPAQPGYGGVTITPIYEVPKTPTPQNPNQAAGTDLSNEFQDYRNRTTPVYDRANAVGKARDDYRNDKRVQTYEQAIPVYISALQSPGDVAGDTLLVNAFAKTLDPMTGVNQREGEAIEGAQPSVDQMKASLLKQFGSDGFGNFTPEGRAKLRAAVTVRMRTLADQYRQARADHANYIKSLDIPGAKPTDIIGPFAGEPFQNAEAVATGHKPTLSYRKLPDGRIVDAVTGQEIDPRTAAREGRPGQAIETAGEGDIGFNQDRSPTGPAMSPEQVTAYNAFLSANREATADDIVAFGKSIGLQFDQHQAAKIADIYHKTGKFASGGEAEFVKPDISDVRGKDATGDAINAGVRGIADTASWGGVDKLVALADTVFKGGTWDENLRRQYAISDFDQEHHGGARLAGQVFGGFLIPFAYEDVAMTAAKTALTEAKAAGATIDAAKDAARIAAGKAVRNKMIKDGAIIGGGYGAGSSRSLAEVPGNAIAGAVEGAAGGAAFGEAGRRIAGRAQAAEIPPLVDPNTLELNQPLDAMTPANRYAALKDAGFSNPSMAATGGRTARVIDSGFTNLPPSAGTMEDVASVAAKEARTAADLTASKFGSAGSLNEGGTAVQNGVKAWLARAEGVRGTTEKGLVGKVYDAIPIAPTTDATLTNTRQTLSDLTQGFSSNAELSAIAADNPTLKKYLDALTPKAKDIVKTIDNRAGGGDVRQRVVGQEAVGGKLSWQDMKRFRSQVGEIIGDRMFVGDGDTSTAQLRSLYGALSEDMRATAASQGPKALNAFERANGVYRAVQQRKEQALVSILGKDALKSPEDAANAIQSMALSRGGDLKRLADVRASTIKSGQWNELASTLIRMGGLPAKGEGRAWNPATFVNWYSSMTQPARNLLFGGEKSALRGALDDFVAVNQQLAKVKGLSNTSNTTPTVLGARSIEALSGAGAVALVMNPLLTMKAAVVGAAAAGLNYGMAKLWTNPKFVQWATGYTKMLAGAAKAGNEPSLAGLKTHSRLLSNLAKSQPSIAQDLAGVREALSLPDPSSSDPSR